MNARECALFLLVFQKEIQRISFKANAIVNSYWFFFGLLMVNCFLLQPSFIVSFTYCMWLLLWQFIMVEPCKEILKTIGEMCHAVVESIDEEKGIYLKDSYKLRKYSEFINYCQEKSKRISK